MRAPIIALMLTIASQAAADCYNPCDNDWWKTATTADVQAELDADVMARDEDGDTPLHKAASFGTSANIQALLAAGADVMARSENGATPLHSATICLTCHTGMIQALLAAGADGKAKML